MENISACGYDEGQDYMANITLHGSKQGNWEKDTWWASNQEANYSMTPGLYVESKFVLNFVVYHSFPQLFIGNKSCVTM